MKELTVLVAEDHPVNMKIIRFMLEKQNCHVVEAENGLEAVELYGKTHPDLVLMDIQMPEMDGIEATGRIRRIEREKGLPPVVISALSANSSPSDRKEAMSAGMDYFISKPVKIEDITALIGEMPALNEKSGTEAVEPVFSYEALLETFSGNKKIVNGLLEEFLAGSETILKTIAAQLKTEDMRGLEGSAHSLKGQLLNIRASAASDAFAKLEHRARAGDIKAAEEAHKLCLTSMVILEKEIKASLND